MCLVIQQGLIPASQACPIAIEMFCDMNSYSSLVDTYKCITLILSIFYNTASTLLAMIHKYTASQCLSTCGNHSCKGPGPSSTGIEYISATILMWMQSLHHIHTCMQYLSDTYTRYNPLKHLVQELLVDFCNIMDLDLANMYITVNHKQAGPPRRGQGRQRMYRRRNHIYICIYKLIGKMGFILCPVWDISNKWQ